MNFNMQLDVAADSNVAFTHREPPALLRSAEACCSQTAFSDRRSQTEEASRLGQNVRSLTGSTEKRSHYLDERSLSGMVNHMS